MKSPMLLAILAACALVGSGNLLPHPLQAQSDTMRIREPRRERHPDGQRRNRRREQSDDRPAGPVFPDTMAKGHGGPMEPESFTPLVFRSFETKRAEGWEDRQTPLFKVLEDPSAPHSPPGIGRAVFPNGFEAGRGPIQANYYLPPGFTRLYLAFWIRLSPEWEGQAAGVNKVFHLWIAGNNRVYLTAQGHDRGPLRAEVHLQAIPGPKVALNLPPNRGGAGIRRGQWQRWEILLRANHPGSPDGEIRWWLDGRLVGDVGQVMLVRPDESADWTHVSWNPTWGGMGGRLERPQFMDMDDIYISAAP